MSSRSSQKLGRVGQLPAPVSETASRLEAAGFEAWLVGESLLELVRDGMPLAFEMATPAPTARVLALFPKSVPTQAARGVVTRPTGGAPIDVVCLPAGDSITDALAQRDFTVAALAFRPTHGLLCDPHQGLAHLEAGRLSCVGRAADRLREDPVRVLRAARMVSELGLRPDPEVEDAMRENAPLLATAPAARRRRELERLLLGPRADAALALLRRTGVEHQLVRGVRDDAPALVAAMPVQLELRLAAWLRGTGTRRLLRELRFGIPRSHHVERLLGHHPIDACVNPSRDRSLLRLLRQLDEVDVAALFQMREWELAHGLETEAASLDVQATRKRLSALRDGIERVRANQSRGERRTTLALDGKAVMELLQCGPGRHVGAALRYAAELVAADPSRNDPAILGEALREWNRRRRQAGDEPEAR